MDLKWTVVESVEVYHKERQVRDLMAKANRVTAAQVAKQVIKMAIEQVVQWEEEFKSEFKKWVLQVFDWTFMTINLKISNTNFVANSTFSPTL